jgi:hypothetical protein
MYLSGGGTAAIGSDNFETTESTWLRSINAGCQYQSDGGFFVPPMLNVIYNGDDWLLLPGVAVGGSFWLDLVPKRLCMDTQAAKEPCTGSLALVYILALPSDVIDRSGS